MARLLVVEDERKLLRSLQLGLEAAGYEVVTAVSGRGAEDRLAAESFDAVILDWMLPGRDGLQILVDLRRSGNRVPVLMLTARDAVEDRVAGLDGGAEDYLTKPFAFAELLARVRALVRRGPAPRETMLWVGDLAVDLLERRVTRAGEEIALRGREFEVLVYLVRHCGEVVTRDMLGRDVWKEPQYSLSNVIEVTVTQLRRRLERPGLPTPIETVRGVGYALRG
jgi:two-component system copper resistance phosphate regulon response regulator CusR